MTETPRKPKKSETLEVRLPYDTKREFLDACREDGTTASEVVRTSIDTYLSERERPEPQQETGKLLTMIPRPIRKFRYLAGAAGALGLAAIVVLPSAAGPDLRAGFDRLDVNKDGVLTAEEFLAPKEGKTVRVERYETHGDAPPGTPKAKAPVVTDEAVAYWLPDAPAPDGKTGNRMVVSQHRQISVYVDGDRKPATEDIRPNPFAGFDKDGDGKITYAEFQATQVAMLTRGFEKLDANSDGSLNPQEYAGIASPPGMGGLKAPDAPPELARPTPEALKAAFTKLDANGDGKMSLAEYLPPA